MKEMLIILFSAILVNNFVLSRFLGICPFLGVSNNLKTAMGMSTAVIAVWSWHRFHVPIYTFAGAPRIAIYRPSYYPDHCRFGQIIETILKNRSLPSTNAGNLSAVDHHNCAILGVAILNIDGDTPFSISGQRSGRRTGLYAGLVPLCGVRSRLDKADIPQTLKGLPITLVAASLVSISFFGFKGLIERLFG